MKQDYYGIIRKNFTKDIDLYVKLAELRDVLG